MHIKECIVSAPGKAILHGEHAVVHGKVALAVSLNLRTYLRLEANPTGKIGINLPNISTFLSFDATALQSPLPDRTADSRNAKELDVDLVARLRGFIGVTDSNSDTSTMAVLAFLYLYMSVFTESGELPGLTVTGSHRPPPGDLEHTARWSSEEMELINSWAFLGEKIIHGNPSGVDNAVSTWGGMLRYHAGKITPLSRVPMLRILLTNTKVPRSTKVLVAGVKEKIDKFPSIMSPVLESIDAISSMCQQTLNEMASEPMPEHYSVLEELMDINQHHLDVLGVGHPSLATLCRVTLGRGLHSKLTGAGGGGCGLTLLRPDTDPSAIHSATRELKDCGYDCWETSIGAPGVQQHSRSSVKEEVLRFLNH
ncbi:hypothetical protein COCON_G00161020 [Conger conger]|uniref:Mevalonate kinase n=1 Tax=Conger conger TaxID=82655 RepID=A0A9Q1DAQ8_CONCO|nr:hypothetical protein COCON_G00161020 [Conger conger]